jgi:hypothetical protein
MSGTIYIAGILQFQSAARFEEALEALRTEESYSEQSSLVPAFEAAMITDTLMVLRHTPIQSGNFYDRIMAEAYLLSEFAGRGYLAGILRDARPRVQVAMAAMAYPVLDGFKPQTDPEVDGDYFPRLQNQHLYYNYRSEGREVEIFWRSKTTIHGKFHYISYPQEGSDDPFNDWWDGHYFLKSGHSLFGVTTDLDAAALSDPAEEEIQLIMDGQAKPGATHFSYVPGTESFRLYTHEGYEDIETPMGEFPRAMKVRVDLYFLPTDEARYMGEASDKVFKKATTTHYFGKGAGLIKLLFEDGELALTRIEAGPTEDSPLLDEEQAQPTAPVSSTERGASRAKPWWKFW